MAGPARGPSLTTDDELRGFGRALETVGAVVGAAGARHPSGRRLTGAGVTGSPALRVTGVEDIGRELSMYGITTGTGDFVANGVVSHNCFARGTHQ